MNILGKRSDLPFSRNSDRKKEKSMVSFTHVQNIICSQTQLDGIAHEQTITWGFQWGGGFYGYRLKFWLFYGYRLIFSVTVNEKVKN